MKTFLKIINVTSIIAFFMLPVQVSGTSMGKINTHELTRSTFLGLIPETTQPDTVVKIQNLHPQGTAHALGLKIGDIIETVNGHSIKDFPTLINILGSINSGESISVKIKRENQFVELTAISQSRPKEQGRKYRVKYGQFTWENEQIRTISYHPRTLRADKAALMFIQGYTCDSIDYGMMPDISLTQLLATYADAGFTVFKMEKPGVGDSEGRLNCQDYNFDIEHSAFVAGLEYFKNYQDVNPNNVFIFGHSLGVLHAGLIAQQGIAKGVIGYGGVIKSWHDYLIDIYSKQSVKYWGVSQSVAQENVANITPFLNQWLNTTDQWTDITTSPKNKSALNGGLLPINDEQVFSRHFSFFRSLNRHNFKEIWSQSQSHALLLHGDYDIQAIENQWAHDIASLVQQQKNLTGTAMIFERTDHSLMQFNNKEDLMRETRGQVRGLGVFNASIAKNTLTWMEKLLAPNINL